MFRSKIKNKKLHCLVLQKPDLLSCQNQDKTVLPLETNLERKSKKPKRFDKVALRNRRGG